MGGRGGAGTTDTAGPGEGRIGGQRGAAGTGAGSPDHSDASGDAGAASAAATLARLTAGPEPVARVLDWLGRRCPGTATLLYADGTPAYPAHHTPPEELADLVRAVHRQRTPSTVRGLGRDTVHVVALGTPADSAQRPDLPYLTLVEVAPNTAPGALTRSEGAPRGAPLAEAARALGVAWRLEEADRRWQRAWHAEANSRETVLQLLMAGQIVMAQRVARIVDRGLPELCWLQVIECPDGDRGRMALLVERASEGRAWWAPCSVRPRHLITLVPASEGGDVAVLARRLLHLEPHCRIGASEPSTLPEAPLAYEQAFHALAVARQLVDGHARFSPDAAPMPRVSAEARRWADALLQPVAGHVPPRRADPDGGELMATLASWLSFAGAANHHLKIHRNTLSARVRLLEHLLGKDLVGSLADQSACWLALRLLQAPSPAPSTGPDVDPDADAGADAGAAPDVPAPTLEALLSTPEVVKWARTQVAPLSPEAFTTVREWLRADARLPVAARELGISLPGARKRLARVEERLGRSLLRAPSARHQLWLSMRALGQL
ncbi:helix-turn-helix domain-containing protein [Streptomyces sp. NPDC005438]|uniref:helix-turn-helix domain-containing protein n=1 Tax=Streptomyces sp. NPDC005438 TaxID=3156880 RepID=UPI0033BD50F7